MNNTIKKTFITGSLLVLVGVVGFSTAYGYGSRGSRVSSGGSVISPVVTTAPVGQVLGETSYTFTQRLAVKSTGEEVKQLQTLLNAKGFDCGVVDGIFGPKTKAGVIKFQLANSLVGDGIVGPLTRLALNK